MALNQEEAQARSELLLRDAEEALQREKLHLFWSQWGATLIGMALMLVVGTAAGVAWREWRESRDGRSTNELMAVLGAPATMNDAQAAAMTDDHAAIAWLLRAGIVTGDDTPERRNELTRYYDAAARAGGDSAWGWLARWNMLRLQMDAPDTDAEKLLGEFDSLARRMGKSELAALPETDAAVVAGERLQDPARALEYLERAEKRVARSTPMAVTIGDLKHLYEIRVQKTAKTQGAQ